MSPQSRSTGPDMIKLADRLRTRDTFVVSVTVSVMPVKNSVNSVSGIIFGTKTTSELLSFIIYKVSSEKKYLGFNIFTLN